MTITQAYSQAAARWPNVPFPLDIYQSHVQQTGSFPNHPVDLFLAGAAGHRLQPAWTSIESDFAPKVQGTLKSLPRADFTPEDLWSDTRTHLMGDSPDSPPLPGGQPPQRMIKYRGEAALLTYFVFLCRRRAITRNKSRHESTGIIDNSPDGRTHIQPVDPSESPASDAQEKEIIAALTAALRDAAAKLSREQQTLLMLIYRDGMLQKDAGQLLGWKDYKTSREMQAAIETLKQALLATHRSLGGDVSDRAMTAAWEGCWAAVWPTKTTPQSPGGAL